MKKTEEIEHRQQQESRTQDQVRADRLLPNADDLIRWLGLVSAWQPAFRRASEADHDHAPKRAAGEPGPIVTADMSIAPVIDQLAKFIAVMSESPEMRYCEFTLEFEQLGSIDGNVLVDGDEAQVMLAPRRDDTTLFLREHRREIERRASRQAGVGIRLSVQGRA